MERNFPIPVLRNKQRCPYLAIHMECNVGGFGNVHCFRPDFHENCNYRQKADRRYKNLDRHKVRELYENLPENIAGLLDTTDKSTDMQSADRPDKKYGVELSGTIFAES